MKDFIKLHPLFILMGLSFIVFGLFIEFVVYILVVFLHELTHGFIAKKIGYKLSKIYLLPFGAMLDINQNFMSSEDEIKVAISGPLCNFILIIVCIAFWWIFPSLYGLTELFVFCNFITGVVNLLPCYPLDGGRVFVALLSKKTTRKKALKICYIFNYIFSLIFISLFFISLKQEINITYALMAIFIFFGTINNKFSGNYSIIKIKQKNKLIYDTKIITVKENVMLYKICSKLNNKKFNIIYVEFINGKIKQITENYFNRLLELYPFNTKIGSILN